MNNRPITECVLICMKDGRWWTHWSLQAEIKQHTSRFYSTDSISAAIRNLRKPRHQARYGLPSGDIVRRRPRQEGPGNEYRLVLKEN